MLFNSYIAADALVISKTLSKMGQTDEAQRFQQLYDNLTAKLEQVNWDQDRHFYYHVMRQNYYQNYSDPQGNIYPNLTQLGGKEMLAPVLLVWPSV